MDRGSPGYSYQEAMAAMEAAVEADPRTHPFGLYASECFPFGLASFQWYASADELFASIAHDLHFLVDEDGDADVTASVLRILGKHGAHSWLDDECINELRSALDGIQNLEWVGEFKDLLSGDGEYARRLRAEFRYDSVEDRGEEPAEFGPLLTEEVDGFVAWLREQGH